MKGYVRNMTPVWAHAMKRSIGPNKTVPLEELYEQYGKKHNLEDGAEFVSWLKTVKLKSSDRWQIVVEEDVPITSEIKEDVDKTKDKVSVESKVVEVVNSKTRNNITPFVTTKMSVADVVQLSVRQAKEVIPKMNDLNLLKYSLQEASQLANKDSLCIVLRKRIKDIQSYR